MQLNFKNERILAIVAHPDDAELLCAGTLARAKQLDQANIAICVLCQGDKGQPDPPLQNLAEVRRGEMQAAANLLEAQLFWLGVPDSELADSRETRVALVQVIRGFQPTLVLGHASNDYHPDHQAASKLAESASWLSVSKGIETDAQPLDGPPALWWMDTVDMHGFDPGFFVDIEPYLELKQSMLACHKSQLSPEEDGGISPLQTLLTRQAQARGAQCGVGAAEAFRIHHAWKRPCAW